MRRLVSGTVATMVMSVGLTVAATPAIAQAPYRAFNDTSYWNTPLPPNAPRHPDSDKIISFIRSDNWTDYVLLSGTDSTGHWGQPVYWAESGDPSYNVTTTRYNLPSAFSDVRIPRGAVPDPTSDSEMTVYDLERGYVIGMWLAKYDSSADTWTAGGGEIFYLDSNGLDGKLPESDEPRNGGNHRGLPPPSFAIRYDEIQAGVVDHLVKIGVNRTRNKNVFPMIGHENGTTYQYAPAEGARIRIRPDVDLRSLGLPVPALTVATALQRYGAIIGDQTGGVVELKTQNTIAEGRGHLWKGVLSSASLSAIPLSMYEVIEDGYQPPPGTTIEQPELEPEPEPVLESQPPPPPRTRVRVVRPTRRVVRAGRPMVIRWRTSTKATRWARVRVRVKNRRTGAVRWRNVSGRIKNSGRLRWRVPRGLRGNNLRFRVIVRDRVGRNAIAMSRGVRTR